MKEQENQVTDRSSLHRYRIEIPNLIDDMALSVYAFRLYVHLKRVAGVTGKCDCSTRQLAQHCHMSMGAVSKAKIELVDADLIRIEHGGRFGRDNITIVDLWPANFAHFAREQQETPCLLHESDVTYASLTSNGVHVTNTPVHGVNTEEEPGIKDNSNQPHASRFSAGNQPWQRQPNEPAKWYSRFEIYLSIGPERNLHMAYLKVRQHRNSPLADNWTPPVGSYASWHHASRTWNWIKRAEAWDVFCRQNLARRNEQQRIEERETRIKLITQQLHVTDAALLAAHLDTLSVEKARNMLPTLRLLYRDMLDQHRINLEPLPSHLLQGYDNPEERELIPFTADELAAATRELAQSEFWELETQRQP